MRDMENKSNNCPAKRFATWLRLRVEQMQAEMLVDWFPSDDAWTGHVGTINEFKPKLFVGDELGILDLIDLRNAMERLDARERKVIELRYWSQLTFREISPLINRTLETSRIIHGRAIGKLKQYYRREENEVRISPSYPSYISGQKARHREAPWSKGKALICADMPSKGKARLRLAKQGKGMAGQLRSGPSKSKSSTLNCVGDFFSLKPHPLPLV